MNREKTDAEIMAAPHWAIIKIQTTYHEGDERSRTNPGHGYPAHSTSAMVYQPYETEEEVLDKIISMQKQDYVRCTVIKAAPLTIETKVELKLITTEG